MKKISFEKGRSMVEMLGVLAIIGVLSIGGIAGYTMAMNRYNANEILDAGSKVIVIAQTRTDGRANISDVGVKTPVGGCASNISTTSLVGGEKLLEIVGCQDKKGVKDAVESIVGSEGKIDGYSLFFDGTSGGGQN